MSIYEHFRKEEHPFVDHVLEWKETVIEQYRPKLTDFLDPRQQTIIQNLVGQQNEVKISFHGGHENVERKRCLLYPSYFEPSFSDYELNIFEIEYPTKFVNLEHRQVLGALMNVGLKRDKFGDIISDGIRFQVIVADEIADFVKWNFTSVGKSNITLKAISEKEVLPMENSLTLHQITASSLRLDTILSEAYRISRTKVKPLVEGTLVKVNWKVIDDPSFLLQEKDIISVRGKGRCEIVANDGKTKKDKWRITVGFPK